MAARWVTAAGQAHGSLSRAAALFQVHSSNAFSEGGTERRFEDGPSLQAGLERRIYWRCHLGLDRDEEWVSGDVRSLENRHLVEPLLAALDGRTYLDWGWTPVAGKAERFRKDGLNLQVKPGEVASRISSAPNPQPEQGIRLPCYRRFAVAGYFIAIGAAGPPQEDRIRFYLNAGAERAVELVVDLIHAFSRSPQTFEIKVLNNPNLFYRCDSIVCYVNQSAGASFLGAIAEVAAGRLRSQTPGFAERLAPGLARAFDRAIPMGLSFGMHRSRLVAEALIAIDSAAENDWSEEQRLDALAGAVAARGLDPAAPHRAPAVDSRSVQVEAG